MRNNLCLAALLLILAGGFTAAQTTNANNVGLPINGVFSGSDIESVQVNNGNLHVQIPLYSLGGRGLGVNYSLIYDNKGGWECMTLPDDSCFLRRAQQGNNTAFNIVSEDSTVVVTHFVQHNCIVNGSTVVARKLTFTIRESNGTAHEHEGEVGPATPAATLSIRFSM